MKPFSTFLLAMLGIVSLLPPSIQAQQDTSSYFPLGLWAIWIDHARLPFTPMYLTQLQWERERSNWQNINANYMVAWIPVWVEDTVMTQTEPMGYKLDIGRSTHGYPGQADTSIRAWIHQASNPPSAFWKRRAGEKIRGIFQTFGDRPGFYSYFVAHEGDFWRYNAGDTAWWPAIGNIIDSIKQIDPAHKSYVVHWGSRGSPPFPFGITLSQFARRFANLGIYEVDDYVFLSDTPPVYSHQQTQIDLVLSSYHDCMVSFRNGTTDWHAVIQSQRDFRNEFCPNYLRRPNQYELRVQAYLALSRGARGITSFLYGSYPPRSGDKPPNPTDLLLGVPENQCDITGYAGLVDVNRIPYNIRNPDPEGIPGYTNLANLHNELRPLGPTIRKLRVYNAFPNTSIPQDNIAHITSASGDKIEIGVFKRIDEGVDSTVYFMLVNRVCNLEGGDVSDPQSVSVTFNHPSFQTLVVTEVVSGETWVLSPRGTFSDFLNPGSGKLYRMDAVLSGTHNFPQGLTVPSGAVLTVQEGSVLRFGQNTSLLVNGTLNAEGTDGNNVTFCSLEPGVQWSGILVTNTCSPSASLVYVSISDASIALTIDERSYFTLDNSTITNCSMGLQIVPPIGPMGPQPPPCIQIIPPKYITNNTFSNVSNGIFVNTSAETHIYGNTMTGMWSSGNQPQELSAGVRCVGSSPRMLRNQVEYFGYGLHAMYGSSPVLEDETSGGYNVIRNNYIGVKCQDGSNAILGFVESGNEGGMNSIYGNEWRDAVLLKKSIVYAQNNWWGTPDDPYRQFFIEEGSKLFYYPWLDYDPNGDSRPFRIGNNTLHSSNRSQPFFENAQYREGKEEEPTILSSPRDLMRQALTERRRRRYNEALLILRAIIANRELPDYARSWAVTLLVPVSQRLLNPNLSGYLRVAEDFYPELVGEIRAALPQSYILQRQFSEAIAAYDANIQRYPDSDLERTALYGKFALVLFSTGDTFQARTLYNALEAQYPSSVERYIAEIQLANYQGGTGGAMPGRQWFGKTISSVQRSKAHVPEEFGLSQNYPNPFNASTVIRYQLPEDGFVSLKIYDVLGREVATLVDEPKRTGYYQVAFEASSFPSGVYFYRMSAVPTARRDLVPKDRRAGSYSAVKKFLLLK